MHMVALNFQTPGKYSVWRSVAMIRSFGVCSMSRYVDASEPRLLQTEWRVWLCAEARGDEKIQSEYGVLWSYVCAAHQ